MPPTVRNDAIPFWTASFGVTKIIEGATLFFTARVAACAICRAIICSCKTVGPLCRFPATSASPSLYWREAYPDFSLDCGWTSVSTTPASPAVFLPLLPIICIISVIFVFINLLKWTEYLFAILGFFFGGLIKDSRRNLAELILVLKVSLQPKKCQNRRSRHGHISLYWKYPPEENTNSLDWVYNIYIYAFNLLITILWSGDATGRKKYEGVQSCYAALD